jgi:hypothetical protein
MQDRGFVKGEITILYNPKPLAFSIFQKPIRQVEVVGIGTHFTATLPLAERVAGWPAAAPPRPTNHFFYDSQSSSSRSDLPKRPVQPWLRVTRGAWICTSA